MLYNTRLGLKPKFRGRGKCGLQLASDISSDVSNCVEMLSRATPWEF